MMGEVEEEDREVDELTGFYTDAYNASRFNLSFSRRHPTPLPPSRQQILRNPPHRTHRLVSILHELRVPKHHCGSVVA